jgi:ribosomal protein S18 acetylase RimI-like enzyme
VSASLRAITPDDHPYVIEHIDEWWGGRPMAAMLPRLFFDHFPATSFAAVDGSGAGALVGFLCGFVSQRDPAEAYIHFVGVDPAARTAGVGRLLYEAFFERARSLGCTRVGCVTSPVNTGSIAFHHRMGFTSEVIADYDGRGGDRVVFARTLDAPGAG